MEKWILYWKRYKERLKTITLILLIVFSVVLTGLIWYSSPAYIEQDSKPSYKISPQIGSAENNVNVKVKDLTAPPFLVVHQKGKHLLITQKQQSYDALNMLIHKETEIINVERKTTTPEEWKYIFEEANAIEMQFFQDMPIAQLDSFFLSLLVSEEKEALKNMGQVSRVILFVEKENPEPRLWFINDENKTVVQAEMGNITTDALQQEITQAVKKSAEIPVVPLFTDQEKAPWDPDATEPFSRVFYLPEKPLQTTSYQYSTKSHSVNKIKQALLGEDDIESLNYNNQEIYMFHDQELVYDRQKNQIQYTNSSNSSPSQNGVISDQISKINSEFMLKHWGWTGRFLLEKVMDDQKDTFVFRLLHEGLPVYWLNEEKKENTEEKVIHLNEIRISPDSKNASGVGTYSRSLYKLDKQLATTPVSLPSKTEVIEELKNKEIDLSEVTQIYPIYQAKWTNHKNVILQPTWRVMTENGEFLLGGKR